VIVQSRYLYLDKIVKGSAARLVVLGKVDGGGDRFAGDGSTAGDLQHPRGRVLARPDGVYARHRLQVAYQRCTLWAQRPRVYQLRACIRSQSMEIT
jgi:hypothetical protein